MRAAAQEHLGQICSDLHSRFGHYGVGQVEVSDLDRVPIRSNRLGVGEIGSSAGTGYH